jgi:hypothetical protein
MEIDIFKLEEGNIIIYNLSYKQLLKGVKIATLNKRPLGRIILNC